MVITTMAGGEQFSANGADVQEHTQRLEWLLSDIPAPRRTGSAPPLIEDLPVSPLAIASSTPNTEDGRTSILLRDIVHGPGNGRHPVSVEADKNLTTLRETPGYAAYYYSHKNINPRLPPPLVSRQSWRASKWSDRHTSAGNGLLASEPEDVRWLRNSTGTSLFSNGHSEVNGFPKMSKTTSPYKPQGGAVNGQNGWYFETDRLVNLNAVAGPSTSQALHMLLEDSNMPRSPGYGHTEGQLGARLSVKSSDGSGSSPFSPIATAGSSSQPSSPHRGMYGNGALDTSNSATGALFSSSPLASSLDSALPSSVGGGGGLLRTTSAGATLSPPKQAPIGRQSSLQRGNSLDMAVPVPLAPGSPVGAVGTPRGGGAVSRGPSKLGLSSALAGEDVSSPMQALSLGASSNDHVVSSPQAAYHTHAQQAPAGPQVHSHVQQRLSFSPQAQAQPHQQAHAAYGGSPPGSQHLAQADRQQQQQPAQFRAGHQPAPQPGPGSHANGQHPGPGMPQQPAGAGMLPYMVPVHQGVPQHGQAAAHMHSTQGMYAPPHGSYLMQGVPYMVPQYHMMHPGMYGNQMPLPPFEGQYQAGPHGNGTPGTSPPMPGPHFAPPPPPYADYDAYYRHMHHQAMMGNSAAMGANSGQGRWQDPGNAWQHRASPTMSGSSGSMQEPGRYRHESYSSAGQPNQRSSGRSNHGSAGPPPRRERSSSSRGSGPPRREGSVGPPHPGMLPHPAPSSILEQFKHNKTRRFELQDIQGHVYEFCRDQHGSRYVQQRVEAGGGAAVAQLLGEVAPGLLALCTDVFGNYVVQKFLEHGTPEQLQQLANTLRGQVLALSLQMYGCRVIQKALEVLRPEERVALAHELEGAVLRAVRDQNGNHVIQKCIETCQPSSNIDFIIEAVRSNVAALSTHPYGCRVVQRVLEHCTVAEAKEAVVADILAAAPVLAQDQYGNYVIQHLLEHGPDTARAEIIRKLADEVVPLSQHKFASNVVERCLQHGAPAERALLIQGVLPTSESGRDALPTMMKDQFANYVVQKMLEVAEGEQRMALLAAMRAHLATLRRLTYGKHLVARVEKLLATGTARQDQAHAPATPSASAAPSSAS